jgi:hypothetical protein
MSHLTSIDTVANKLPSLLISYIPEPMQSLHADPFFLLILLSLIIISYIGPLMSVTYPLIVYGAPVIFYRAAYDNHELTDEVRANYVSYLKLSLVCITLEYIFGLDAYITRVLLILWKVNLYYPHAMVTYKCRHED